MSASSGLDLEYTLLNGQEGDIEGSSTEIEYEDIPLTGGPPVESVRGDSSKGEPGDYAEGIQPAYGTSVPGSLTLGVVEVSGDSHHGVCDGTA